MIVMMVDFLKTGYGEYMIQGFVVYRGYWRKGKKHGKAEFRTSREEKFIEAVFCDGQMLED